MKNAIIILAIVQVFAGALNAQLATGGAGFLRMGYSNLPGSASVFNEIAPPGITGFNDNFATIGGEGYYRNNKIILALNGDIGIQGVQLTDTKAAEALSGAAYLRAGHIIKESKTYWIYPSVGMGIAAIGLNTYDQLNAESCNEKTSYLLNTSFDFGINTDFILLGAQVEKKYNALILGLRTGYRVSYANNSWHGWNNDKINVTPAYGYHGFYISATIGIGSFANKR